MTDLLHATIEAFALPDGIYKLTTDMLRAGADRSRNLDPHKVAQHYGLTPEQVREHRDLQFQGAGKLEPTFQGGVNG